MTETKQPDTKPTENPKQSAREKLLAAMRDLSPEDRDYFLQQGVAMPAVGAGTLEQQRKFGYWCKYCNNMALEFIGETFSTGGGAESRFPPTNLPIGQIPWAQPKLPVSRINRARPICQCCGQLVVLATDRLIKKYIWDMAIFNEKRDAGFEELRKFREDAQRGRLGDRLGIEYGAGEPDNSRLLAEARARQEEAAAKAGMPSPTAVAEQTAADFNLMEGLQKRSIKVGKER